MKKLIVWVMILAITFSSSAFALDLDGMLGGLTSMFSPDAEGAHLPGETAETDDVSITLTNVYRSGKNDFYTPADGYEYVIIEFTFENNSKEELALSTMLSFVTWCDEQMYSISLEALGTAAISGKMQLDCVVASGDSITGVIGYEVPEEWKEVIVEFKKDTFIGKPIKFAFNNDI